MSVIGRVMTGFNLLTSGLIDDFGRKGVRSITPTLWIRSCADSNRRGYACGDKQAHVRSRVRTTDGGTAAYARARQARLAPPEARIRCGPSRRPGRSAGRDLAADQWATVG